MTTLDMISPAFSVLALPLLMAYSNGWNAWVRAVNRPPAPPSVSAWDRVVGSPVKTWKEEAWRTSRNWTRFGLLMATDLLEICAVNYAGALLGVSVDTFHMTPAQLQLRDPESDISLTSALWGFTGAAVIGFPLSILGWQLHTDTWRGWGSLLPTSALGRQHWLALPAKIVDVVVFNVLFVRLVEAVRGKVGIVPQPLGWLTSDAENNREDPALYDEEREERSTARVILDRARLFAISSAAGSACSLVLVGLQVPAIIVWNRMLAEPGRFASVVACVRHIWASEGLAGFYRDLPLFALNLINIA